MIMSLDDMEPEFKIGDIVTFKPYDEELPARVTKISYFDLWGNPTDMPRYQLNSTGDPMHKPVVGMTSGLCIMESKHFVSYEEAQLIARGQIDPCKYDPTL